MELISPSIINKSAYTKMLLYNKENLTKEELLKVGLNIRVLQLCKNGLDKNRSKWNVEFKNIWDEIHISIPIGNYLSWAIPRSFTLIL